MGSNWEMTRWKRINGELELESKNAVKRELESGSGGVGVGELKRLGNRKGGFRPISKLVLKQTIK